MKQAAVDLYDLLPDSCRRFPKRHRWAMFGTPLRDPLDQMKEATTLELATGHYFLAYTSRAMEGGGESKRDGEKSDISLCLLPNSL
uniref:Uncharacterized protein n=1 Tax=Esox lucius TaxID=8010 RepID=A0AAY5JXH5_ESOLU